MDGRHRVRRFHLLPHVGPAGMTADIVAGLFDEQDRIKARLVEIDHQLSKQGKAYWAAQGYTVMPRIEALRRAVGR